MKPSSFQRWLFEAINLLLVLTFSIPLSALLGLAFGYVSQLTLWVLCVVALGFLAGRLTMRLSAGAAMLGCGLAAAGADAFISDDPAAIAAAAWALAEPYFLSSLSETPSVSVLMRSEPADTQ